MLSPAEMQLLSSRKCNARGVEVCDLILAEGMYPLKDIAPALPARQHLSAAETADPASSAGAAAGGPPARPHSSGANCRGAVRSGSANVQVPAEPAPLGGTDVV